MAQSQTASRRIGIDVTGWRNPRGDGRFVRNAVSAMLAIGDRPSAGVGAEPVLIADRATAAELPDLGDRAAVAVAEQSVDPVAALAAGSSRRPADIARMTTAARGADLSALLAPSLYSWFPAPGVPVLLGIHDATAITHEHLVLPSRRDRLAWRLKRRLAVRGASRIFTVSESSKRALADGLGERAGDLAVVGEAPDPVFTARPPGDVAADLASIGLAADAAPIVYGAGLSPHKDVETLVAAYGRLAAAGDPPPLVIAGEHAGAYPSSAEALISRVRAARLGGSVLLPGYLSDPVLASLYTAATAAVATSRSEGFGLAAVEAAACGAPVVLSGIDAHRESLGEAGLYFPVGDPRALADALAELSGSPQRIAAAGARARLAVGRLSWQRTADQLWALLREL